MSTPLSQIANTAELARAFCDTSLDLAYCNRNPDDQDAREALPATRCRERRLELWLLECFARTPSVHAVYVESHQVILYRHEGNIRIASKTSPLFLKWVPCTPDVMACESSEGAAVPLDFASTY
jgi:hypothetical protein